MSTQAADLRRILQTTKTVALVGASNKPERASFHVMEFLQQKGMRVYPINPGLAGQKLHGETVLASLVDVPAPIDMVDVFRNAEDAGKVIDEAIALKATKQIKTVWLQLGIINEAAAARATAAGLEIVMDNCPMKAWHQLGL